CSFKARTSTRTASRPRRPISPLSGWRCSVRNPSTRACLPRRMLTPGFVASITMPQPDYTVDELATIRVPTTVAIADHDEGIKRSHSELIARSIPNARVVVLKDVSHFAPIQNPVGYAEAIEASMSGRHMSSVTEPER